MAKIIRSLSRAELLEVAVTIEARILAGDSRDEIMDAIGYTTEQYNEARRFMLDQKVEDLRGKSREHQYVEYVLEQRGVIRTLDKLAKDLDTKSQYNAVVGALRLRSELLDKIIDRGVNFGLIKKEPDRKEIIAGVIMADMSTGDLKKAILDHGKSSRELLEKFGESSFMELPEKPLHYPDPARDKPDFVTEGEEIDDEADLDAEMKAKSKKIALAPKPKPKKRPPKK